MSGETMHYKKNQHHKRINNHKTGWSWKLLYSQRRMWKRFKREHKIDYFE